MNTIKQIPLLGYQVKKVLLPGSPNNHNICYLALTGVITPELATYINGISLLLFGSASLATGKIVYNK